MKLSVKFILLTTTILMTSLVNGKEMFGKSTVIGARHQTVIRSVPVRASVPKIQKPKLFVGKPYKITVFANDWDDSFLEVDDVITSYRRRDLNKIEHEDGISEKVRWRLFLARQLAMLKYKEVHG